MNGTSICKQRRRLLTLLSLAVLLTLALVVTPIGYAGQYTYRSLYDTANVGFPGLSPPALNDSGVVCFLAVLASKSVIVSGSGGSLTVIATVGTSYSSFGPYPAINNSGVVVFTANRTGGLPGIFTGNGTSPPTNINGLLSGNFTQDLGVPSINDSGQVAFNAFNGSQNGIYVGDGGVPTPIPANAFASVDVNNSTTVTWSDVSRVLQSRATAITRVTDTSGPFALLPTSPAINATGDIAYAGLLDDGGQALALYNATTQTNAILASTHTGFTSLSFEPGINDSGHVVFNGATARGSGLYGGSDPVNDLVVAQGMALFGGTISSYQFFRNGFNNSGQLAFRYILSEGRTGIGLATPVPEPASGALVVIGLTLYLWIYCYRRSAMSFASSRVRNDSL